MSELGQKIIAETRKVAAANPSFVYTKVLGGCQYIREGAPSCILGHALWNLKLIDAKCQWDKWDNSGIEAVLEDWDVDLDEVTWLVNVQDHQDDGYSWGAAIDRADIW